VKCKKSVEGRFAHDRCESNIKISVLVGAQEVRWERGGAERAGEYTFQWKGE
jgi:hypothetical protein